MARASQTPGPHPGAHLPPGRSAPGSGRGHRPPAAPWRPGGERGAAPQGRAPARSRSSQLMIENTHKQVRQGPAVDQCKRFLFYKEVSTTVV